MLLLVRVFFCGFFLFNSLPHLVKGITGQMHMTPFKRVSSPYLNIVWAFVNIVISLLILGFDPRTGSLNTLTGTQVWVFLLGGFAISMADANLFSNPNAKLPWHKD